MGTSIAGVGTSQISDALFAKLDTRQKGYIDAADLQTTGANASDQAQAAEVFAQIDGDSDGRVTKSELSLAIEKVGQELNAQLDQSRVGAAAGGAPEGEAQAAQGARPAGGGGPPAKAGAAQEEEAKYIAAADFDGDGTVSQAESAQYKKMMASAEARAQQQVSQYTQIDSQDTASPAVDTLA